jgi:hypothetical protein
MKLLLKEFPNLIKRLVGPEDGSLRQPGGLKIETVA